MRRSASDASEPDLPTQLREAFTAADPEAAWYFDRAQERVVRISHGVTNIPDLPAGDVEDNEHRYVEIPAVLESDVHTWMEEFVEAHPDPNVATLLDERQGANARFLKKLEAANPEALAAWKTYHAARIDESLAMWRATLG